MTEPEYHDRYEDEKEDEGVSTTWLILALIVVATAFWTVGQSNQDARASTIQECKDTYGDYAAYNELKYICLDAEPHEEHIVTALKNNQPMTASSLAQTMELSYSQTRAVLEALARQGKVYSYDRGWSEDGWKTLDNVSEATQ